MRLATKHFTFAKEPIIFQKCRNFSCGFVFRQPRMIHCQMSRCETLCCRLSFGTATSWVVSVAWHFVKVSAFVWWQVHRTFVPYLRVSPACDWIEGSFCTLPHQAKAKNGRNLSVGFVTRRNQIVRTSSFRDLSVIARPGKSKVYSEHSWISGWVQ